MNENFAQGYPYYPYANNNVAYGMQQPNYPKASGTLTAEETATAQKLINPQTSIKPTELETIQGMCSHYFDNGQPALDWTGNGNLKKCQRCGTIVNFDDCPTGEEAAELFNRAKNAMEIAKFVSFDMPVNVKRTFFGNTIPYITKVPMILNSAYDKIKAIQQPMQYNYAQNQAGYNLFNMVRNGYNPAFAAQPQQQPMGQPAPQVGFAQVQPQPMMMNPMMNQPVAGVNPFYAGQQPMMNQPVQAQPTAPVMNPMYANFTGNYQAPGVAAPVVETPATTATTSDTATTVKQGNV